MADTPTTPGFNPNTASIADILSGFKRTAVNDPGGAHLVGGDEFGEFARSRWMPLAEGMAPADFNTQSTPADLPVVPNVSAKAIAGIQNATKRLTQPLGKGGGDSIWDAYSSMFEGGAQSAPELNEAGKPVGTGTYDMTGMSFGEKLGDFLNFGLDAFTGVNLKEGTFSPLGAAPGGFFLDKLFEGITGKDLSLSFDPWDVNDIEGLGTIDDILGMSDSEFQEWSDTSYNNLTSGGSYEGSDSIGSLDPIGPAEDLSQYLTPDSGGDSGGQDSAPSDSYDPAEHGFT